MSDFALGNVVQIKGGGPRMIVAAILDDGRIECIWMEDGKPRQELVLPSMIERVAQLKVSGAPETE